MLDRTIVEFLLKHTCEIFSVDEDELIATKNDLKKVEFTFENASSKINIQHKSKMIPCIIYDNYLTPEQKSQLNKQEFCMWWTEVSEGDIDDMINRILELDQEFKLQFPKDGEGEEE